MKSRSDLWTLVLFAILAASPACAADRRDELIAEVLAMLTGTSVTEIEFVDEKPTAPFANWDLAWTAAHLRGLARIDETSTVDQATARIIAGEQAGCHGTFTVDKSIRGDSAFVRTTCREAMTVVRVIYALAPRAAGGSYVNVIFDPDDVLAHRAKNLHKAATMSLARRRAFPL